MGLLDSFMPGETHGMPTARGGLLDDQLLQIGLSILANNNTKNTGQVLGRGAMQGMQNYQQNQSIAQQRKMQDMQAKRYEQQGKQFDAEEAAHVDFDTKYPQYKGLSRIDPKAAIKIANPAFANNSADPYFTPIATAGGLGSFDNRSGKFVLVQDANGRPVVKSADSPEVRGSVKEAEARATAGYDVNTAIPGVVSTDRQVAEMANPGLINGKRTVNAQAMPSSNFNTPYPVTFGAPGTTPTDLAEGVTGESSIQMRNPSRPNVQDNYTPQVGGIAVPTPEAQAAATEMAKAKAENTVKAQAGLPNVIQESQNTIGLIDELLKSPGLKTAVGASRMFGMQNIPGTAAKDFDVRLDQLKGKQFLQAYESLKGAGAITDIEGTKAGNAIARMDASASEKEFEKAAREFQSIIKQGVERAKAKAGDSAIMPSREVMPPRRRVFNPKTGKIE
jgi:hypothetical protein